MSECFTINMAGDVQLPSLRLAAQVIQRLVPKGFGCPTSVLKVSYNQELNTVDESDDEEEAKVILNTDGSIVIEEKEWIGCSIDIYSKFCNFYLIISSIDFVVVNIDISKKKLINILKSGQSEYLFELIGLIATICQVKAGYGEMEQAFCVFDVNKIIELILKRESDLKFPSSFGLMSVELTDEVEKIEEFKKDFRIFKLKSKYYALLEKDFVEIYEEES